MKIVGTHDGWVLERLEKELEGLSFPEITYFITYARYKRTRDETLAAALFTHFEEKNPKKFIKAAQEVDIAICLSENTKRDVLKYRIFERDAVHVIHCGSDIARDDITFGVVGRTYPSGRKGEYLIEAVDKEFRILGLGLGWPCTTFNNYDTKARLAFYDLIDYLIVPSLQEGGPMPVLDAIARGVPVIAPDVGWCWDYPVIKYEKGNVESLLGVCRKLANVRTWKDWRNDHKEVFKKYV